MSTNAVRPSPEWLRYLERINFMLAVLIYRCVHGLVPRYLSDYIQHVANSSRCCLRSSSSLQLVIHGYPVSTVGDRVSIGWKPPLEQNRLKTSLFPIISFLFFSF